MDELATIVNNIESLLQQIKQSTAGEATKEELPPANDMPPEMPPPDEVPPDLVKSIAKILKQMETDEEKKKKDGVGKSSEGATGSDDAKTKIEDQPDVNLENISDVAKAFIQLARKKGAYKSKDEPDAKLYKAVEELAGHVTTQNQALTTLIEGLGLVNNIQKSMDEKKKAEEHRPLADQNDVAKSLDFIREIAGVKKGDSADKPVAAPDQHTLMKALTQDDGKALKMIFSGRKE